MTANPLPETIHYHFFVDPYQFKDFRVIRNEQRSGRKHRFYALSDTPYFTVRLPEEVFSKPVACLRRDGYAFKASQTAQLQSHPIWSSIESFKDKVKSLQLSTPNQVSSFLDSREYRSKSSNKPYQDHLSFYREYVLKPAIAELDYEWSKVQNHWAEFAALHKTGEPSPATPVPKSKVLPQKPSFEFETDPKNLDQFEVSHEWYDKRLGHKFSFGYIAWFFHTQPPEIMKGKSLACVDERGNPLPANLSNQLHKHPVWIAVRRFQNHSLPVNFAAMEDLQDFVHFSHYKSDNPKPVIRDVKRYYSKTVLPLILNRLDREWQVILNEWYDFLRLRAKLLSD